MVYAFFLFLYLLWKFFSQRGNISLWSGPDISWSLRTVTCFCFVWQSARCQVSGYKSLTGYFPTEGGPQVIATICESVWKRLWEILRWKPYAGSLLYEIMWPSVCADHQPTLQQHAGCLYALRSLTSACTIFSASEQVLTHHMRRLNKQGSHTVVNVLEKTPDKTKWLTPCMLALVLSLLIMRQRCSLLLRMGNLLVVWVSHIALIKLWPI